MYHRFNKVLLLLPVVALFAFLPMTVRPAQPVPMSSQIAAGDGGLTATKASSTSVSLSWRWDSSLEQPTSYNVTVTDLSTFTVVQSFSTSSTSATISSLTAGHTYRFSVGANGCVIAEDVLM